MVSVKQILGSKASAAVYAVEPEDPVLEAIQAMAEHSIGALLVMRGSELLGIVSERDYARKVILMGRSSSETPVWQIMSAPVITVTPDVSVSECMQLMTDQRVRHLPVMEQGRVVGMLSIGDVVRAVLQEQQRTIKDLESYIRS